MRHARMVVVAVEGLVGGQVLVVLVGVMLVLAAAGFDRVALVKVPLLVALAEVVAPVDVIVAGPVQVVVVQVVGVRLPKHMD